MGSDVYVLSGHDAKDKNKHTHMFQIMWMTSRRRLQSFFGVLEDDRLVAHMLTCVAKSTKTEILMIITFFF